MSDVSEHSDSEFYFPKKKKKKKEKRGGHMIKCLLTELGRAGRENIWPSVRTPRPRAKYFPVRPSYSVNKYILLAGVFCVVSSNATLLERETIEYYCTCGPWYFSYTYKTPKVEL